MFLFPPCFLQGSLMKLLGKLYCNYTVANIYIGNCSSKWSISSTCSSNCFQQNFSNLYSTQIFMSKVAGLKIYYCRKWHPGCLRHGWCRQKIVWHFGLFRSPGIKFPQHFEFKIICIFNKKVSQLVSQIYPKYFSENYLKKLVTVNMNGPPYDIWLFCITTEEVWV